MGKKKRAGLAALGAAVALLFGVTPAWGECLVSGSDYTVGAKAAVVMEAQTGTLLFAQEAHKKLPMASTTKIMTALLTLEQEGLDETFTVDPVAIQVEGSSMGLQEGDAVTLRALAGGMLTASGNDAAGAAAVRIDGSKEAFVQRMNRRAQELGMLETHFVTPSGLDAEEHYSTAYDMALLGRAALQNPVFAEMAGQKRLALTYGNPPYRRSLLNHNRLLSLYPDAIGIKTGFTKKAGRCLVSAAQRDGVTLIVVTLNCGDDWNTHMALYERYFPMVTVQELRPQGEITLPVTGGEAPAVPLRATESPVLAQVQGQEGKIEGKIFAPNFWYAPILEGDIVGKIVYYKEGQPVGESPLAAAATVRAAALAEEPRKKGLFSWLKGR